MKEEKTKSINECKNTYKVLKDTYFENTPIPAFDGI